MDPVETAELVEGAGIAGNANQGGRRQVTLLSRERWAEVEKELGVELAPGTRRANLLVSGLELEETIDRVVRIGGCRLRILGETRPCDLMDRRLRCWPTCRDESGRLADSFARLRRHSNRPLLHRQ